MKHLARGWGALAALLLVTSPLYAQTTGRITGKIVDTSGGALPGVVITVTSPNLQGAQSTTTNADGEFRLLALPPGTYDVKAELAGFRTLDRKVVVVGSDRSVSIDLQMGVAPVSEVVTVTGEYLMRNAGRVVSKTMIMEHVWDYNFDPQPNVVESRICSLRDKIDRGFDRKLIQTVRGVGYALKAAS